MFEKILVPLDGSIRAEKILGYVVDLAVLHNSTVIVLQVLDPAADISTAGFFTPSREQLEKKKQEAEAYLDSVKARLQEKKIETRTLILTGIPLDCICQTAEKEKAGLIAMASHGRTGASRLFYGSVSAGILNQIDRPLLMIRSREGE
ncbi:MAG: universal stress protein [Desulfobacterales bacterium]|nr:MAG: universal stress protein [Desulfobacterales bacterium]